MTHPKSHNVESDLNIVNKQYNLNAPFQDGHYKRYTDIANIFISKPFPFL